MAAAASSGGGGLSAGEGDAAFRATQQAMEQQNEIAQVDDLVQSMPPLATFTPAPSPAELDGRLLVVRVDVDESDLLAYRYAIRSVPTLLVVQGGRVLNQMVGAAPKDTIRDFVEPYLAG